MFEQKVDPEVARKEIEDWLDFKKVSPKKRDEHRDSMDTLIDSICLGRMSIGEDKVISHQLVFPIGEGGCIDKLNYRPRITHEMIATRMKYVKATDLEGRVMGYASALTNQPTAILTKLDSEDLPILQSIVSFFI